MQRHTPTPPATHHTHMLDGACTQHTADTVWGCRPLQPPGRELPVTLLPSPPSRRSPPHVWCRGVQAIACCAWHADSSSQSPWGAPEASLLAAATWCWRSRARMPQYSHHPHTCQHMARGAQILKASSVARSHGPKNHTLRHLQPHCSCSCTACLATHVLLHAPAVSEHRCMRGAHLLGEGEGGVPPPPTSLPCLPPLCATLNMSPSAPMPCRRRREFRPPAATATPCRQNNAPNQRRSSCLVTAAATHRPPPHARQQLRTCTLSPAQTGNTRVMLQASPHMTWSTQLSRAQGTGQVEHVLKQ
jgi:hypothetical protein